VREDDAVGEDEEDEGVRGDKEDKEVGEQREIMIINSCLLPFD
jgi:hypothetical protein